MDAFDAYLNDMVSKTQKAFSEFSGIKWLNSYNSARLLGQRKKLIEKIETSCFKETKPYYKQLSKGCRICGAGAWSCLFITGKCNAGCFYCPTSQQKDEIPATQRFHFETPESYAEYINFLKFKGVSFSGGEPLLFFDRTLQYLKEIRKSCSPEIYIWMYTNGILADKLKFEQLAAAGLNEIRFDIGATGYQLDKVRLAKGIIPNITIEIPAVPEEKERLKKLLPEIINAGVTNLNLHQLRLTKHNAPKLLKRNYTYIPAEQPVVLESELAALEILNYAQENHLGIGINYCSFWFKNRFQQTGFRKQVANALAEPGETITEKGFIREYDGNSLAYKTLQLSEIPEEQANGSSIRLKNKTYRIAKENALKTLALQEQLKTGAEKLFQQEPDEIPGKPPLFDIWNMEYIERGLREF